MEDKPKPVPGKPIQNKRAPLVANTDVKRQIEQVLREVALGGCVDVTSHFKMRGAQRGFTTPAALRVLKRGRVISGPEFCPNFCNWKFSVEGEHDDGALVVVAAVSAGDLGRPWSHSVMLITGYIR